MIDKDHNEDHEIKLITSLIGNQKHLDQQMLSARPKKILIINSGGTISMFPSSKGYVTRKDALVEFLRSNPFCCDQDYTFFEGKDEFLITPLSAYNRRIWFKIIELERLLDSSNMGPEDWVTIATQIEKNYDQYDGFIVLHGTDSMAYTASALSLMFQNLSKTVIITGSQVPLSQPRNDGINNVLNALTIAGHFTIPEVLITFADKLLRGNRSQKVSSSSLHSFQSPKFEPLGLFGVHIQVKWDLIRTQVSGDPLKVNKNFCTEVRVIRMNPLLTHEMLKSTLDHPGLKGLIIETYGSGNMKTHEPILNVIGDACKKGIIIVNISQCHQSSVEMLYETGILLRDLGVISGCDMTSEAALTKLAYLLGLGLSKQEIESEMQRDMRGELTPEQIKSHGEPFLKALSEALSRESTDFDLSRDLVLPNILCHLSIEKSTLFNIEELDANYSAQDYDMRSILHVAAREGSLEIAELVLKNAPEVVNATDRWQHSPMFEAITSRKLQMIHLLIRFKGSLIAPLSELTSQLMKAVLNKDNDVLELYFQAGVRDFSQFRTFDNRTLAHLAASVNNVEALKFLGKPGVLFDWNMKDRFGRTPQDELKYQQRKPK